jgi:hypothetical protein
MRTAERYLHLQMTTVDEARAAVESLVDGTLDKSRLMAHSEEDEDWFHRNPSPYAGRRS